MRTRTREEETSEEHVYGLKVQKRGNAACDNKKAQGGNIKQHTRLLVSNKPIMMCVQCKISLVLWFITIWHLLIYPPPFSQGRFWFLPCFSLLVANTHSFHHHSIFCSFKVNNLLNPSVTSSLFHLITLSKCLHPNTTDLPVCFQVIRSFFLFKTPGFKLQTGRTKFLHQNKNGKRDFVITD